MNKRYMDAYISRMFWNKRHGIRATSVSMRCPCGAIESKPITYLLVSDEIWNDEQSNCASEIRSQQEAWLTCYGVDKDGLFIVVEGKDDLGAHVGRVAPDAGAGRRALQHHVAGVVGRYAELLCVQQSHSIPIVKY